MLSHQLSKLEGVVILVIIFFAKLNPCPLAEFLLSILHVSLSANNIIIKAWVSVVLDGVIVLLEE